MMIMHIRLGDLRSIIMSEAIKRFWTSRASAYLGGAGSDSFPDEDDAVWYDTPDPDDLDLASHLRDEDDPASADQGPVPVDRSDDPYVAIDPYVKDFFQPAKTRFNTF